MPILLIIILFLTIISLPEKKETRSHALKSTNLSFSPASTQTVPIQATVYQNVPLDIMVDPGMNWVSLIRLVINYDSTKFQPSGLTPFVNNPSAFPVILEGPVYTTGKISVVLSIGSDPTRAIVEPTKVGTITLLATVVNTGTSTVSYDTQTQVFSVGPNDQAQENVLASTTPAYITSKAGNITPTITLTPYPTITPRPTITPTQYLTPTPTPEGGIPTSTPRPPTPTPGGGNPTSTPQPTNPPGWNTPTPNPGGDNKPPVVKIINPTTSVFSGLVLVQATAWDDVGVTAVEFYIDSARYTTDYAAPYCLVDPTGLICDRWDSSTIPEGNHELKAIAYDAAGNSGTDTKMFTVSRLSPTPGGPTLTPGPDSTTINLKLRFHGIGSSGDTANPKTFTLSNKTPLHQERELNIQIVNTDNELIQTKLATSFYSDDKGLFNSLMILSDPLPPGVYVIKAKTNGYLRKLLPDYLTVTPNKYTYDMGTTDLIAGDIDGNNAVNILDYNILYDCGYGAIKPLPMIVSNSLYNSNTCKSHPDREFADLNDNGTVEASDYNLFLREVSVQFGD